MIGRYRRRYLYPTRSRPRRRTRRKPRRARQLVHRRTPGPRRNRRRTPPVRPRRSSNRPPRFSRRTRRVWSRRRPRMRRTCCRRSRPAPDAVALTGGFLDDRRPLRVDDHPSALRLDDVAGPFRIGEGEDVLDRLLRVNRVFEVVAFGGSRLPEVRDAVVGTDDDRARVRFVTDVAGEPVQLPDPCAGRPFIVDGNFITCDK